MNADLTGVLRAVVKADLAFETKLLTLPPPLISDFRNEAEFHKHMKKHDQCMPGDVVRHIAMIFFMLKARDVGSPDRMAKFIDDHNDYVQDKIDRLGKTPREQLEAEELSKALFGAQVRRHVIDNCRYFGNEGNIALDASSLGRLCFEFYGRTGLEDAMKVLARLGCFRQEKALLNMTVYVSRGVLEKMFAEYLSDLHSGIHSIPGAEA